MPIDYEMTLQEALTTLEQCGQEYTQRADAFRKLAAAALLAYQIHDGKDQAERERQVVLQDLERVKEERQRATLETEGLKRSLVTLKDDVDKTNAALKAQLTTQQADITTEFQAWKTQLGADRALLLHAHEEEMAALTQEQQALQTQLDGLKAELDQVRRRVMAATRTEA